MSSDLLSYGQILVSPPQLAEVDVSSDRANEEGITICHY
ncbi:MAG: hypothetical protein ACI898_001993 [Flavobacteriales bacterium]|jgi:hypothetical protein